MHRRLSRRRGPSAVGRVSRQRLTGNVEPDRACSRGRRARDGYHLLGVRQRRSRKRRRQRRQRNKRLHRDGNGHGRRDRNRGHRGHRGRRSASRRSGITPRPRGVMQLHAGHREPGGHDGQGQGREAPAARQRRPGVPFRLTTLSDHIQRGTLRTAHPAWPAPVLPGQGYRRARKAPPAISRGGLCLFEPLLVRARHPSRRPRRLTRETACSNPVLVAP